jgi:SAM-dependent methyltransferase
MSKQWYEELYESFQNYDQEPYARNTQAEVDVIERVIGRHRSSGILDVGCGTGRHALELARRGHQVVGIDLSEEMLAKGRVAAAEENLNLAFIARDARDLGLNAEFEVAIILCEGAFSLMETDEMDRLILSNVACALEPGGTLIMTAPNAAYMLARASEDSTFDPVTCREASELAITSQDGRKRILDCTQRYYTCPELRWLLEQAGFHHVEFIADTNAGFNHEIKPSTDHFELGVIARDHSPRR